MMLSCDITLARGDFTLDVAFDVPPGVTALHGASGAGKTTIAQALAGGVTPDAGRIALGGRVLFDAATGTRLPAHRRRVGLVYQDARLFPHMSVRRNLAYGGAIRGDILELLGIGALLERAPATLSGGEAQRVALARALFAGPDALVLDEPLAALDAARKDRVLPWLERLKQVSDLPILYISHATEEVARLADRLVILERGRVAAQGPLDELLADPALMPRFGPRAAGAVLRARVLRFDTGDGLTELATDAGRLVLPGRLGAPGEVIRVRVPAQDVTLALKRPEGLSALNILAVTVTALHEGHGPGVGVGLASGRDRLLARVTRRSARELDLRVGQPLHAIVKATAVAAVDIGGPG